MVVGFLGNARESAVIDGDFTDGAGCLARE